MRSVLFAGLTLMMNGPLPALAGPFIFAGTDADDHGSATATANQDGWFFMQRAIENLGASVAADGKVNRVVVALGSNPGTRAGNAAASAFQFSALAATWSFVNVNGAAALSAFFDGTSATNVGNTGLIMLDSGANVTGGLDPSELAVLTSRANDLNSFLGAGGGLFSQANGYGFLSALVPSLMVNEFEAQNIALTATGQAAFPGLTNGDLGAGPYHENFVSVGTIPVLGTGIGANVGKAIIIGSATGTITDPVSVPEPWSLTLLFSGLVASALVRQRTS